MVNWQDISSGFTEELQKNWESKGFSYEEVRDWINIGLNLEDVGFASWLRDIKKFDSEWVLNYVDVEELRKEYQENSEIKDENEVTNAQEWLNENYPKEEREGIKEINAGNQQLEGDLDLSDFVNLERLDFSFNKLEEIKFISTIEYPEKLIYLNLRDNFFSPSNLEVFIAFHQLRELYLGTINPFRIFFSSYNRFYGSLKPLGRLKKLKKLCISNTEVNRGFKYLPDGLEEIFFADEREKNTGEDLGLTEIMEELNSCNGKVRKLKEGRKSEEEKIKNLEKKTLVFQRLSNEWKKKFDEKTIAFRRLEKEKSELEKELVNLQIKHEKEVEKNGLLSQQLENKEVKLNELEKKYSISEQLTKEYLQKQKTENRKLEEQLSDLQNQKQNKQSQIVQNPYHILKKK